MWLSLVSQGKRRINTRSATRVVLFAVMAAAWLGSSSFGFAGAKESAQKERLEASPQAKTIPADLIEVVDAHYASLEGLASGSREAQERQRQVVQTLGFPLEARSVRTGIVLRLIPEGKYMMGGEPLGETPHQVTLAEPFYCGKFEVTQAQWEQVMGNNPAYFKNEGEDAPVESVSWYDCQVFVKRLCQLEGVPEATYRLLWEAEWEYVCRAGTTTMFCYGDDLDFRMANFLPISVGRNDQGGSTVRVGSFRSNAFGLHDMHGNVAEWCLDWAGGYWSSDGTDPLGLQSGLDRYLRGGSWFDPVFFCSSAASGFRASPDSRSKHVGLRIVRTLSSYVVKSPALVSQAPALAPDVRIQKRFLGKVVDSGTEQNFIVPDLEMEMVYIESGSFEMGSNSVYKDSPIHTVKISRVFWMGKFEVTQNQYRVVTGSNPSNSMGSDLPVENVSWNGAVAFCRDLTDRERRAGRLPAGYVYRLPTEAEWEYVARGGRKSRGLDYPGSNNLDEVAWYSGNSGGKTHPVGQKKPNELEIHDMLGNVSEWCHDSYDAGYYTKSPSSDPPGPLLFGPRVIRGGSYDSKSCSIANRSMNAAGDRRRHRGFRIVASWPLD